MYREIAAQLSVTEASLRKHAQRHNWRQIRTAALATASQTVKNHDGQTLAQQLRATSEELQRNSETIRGKLSKEVLQQISVLENRPPTSFSELQTTKDGGEGRSSVLKRVVDSASIIHDWQGESIAKSIIEIGQLRQFDEFVRPTAIDVESVPQAQE